MKKSKNVLSNVACDICGEAPDIIHDDKSIHGPWGYFCDKCHPLYGVGIGTTHDNTGPKPEPRPLIAKDSPIIGKE